MSTAQQDRTQQEKAEVTAQPEIAALRTIRETVEKAAGKVFGEPIQQDGMTVLPMASVATGGGGGGGSAPSGSAKPAGPDGAGGEGGGFGVMAKPAGAFVIKDGTVSWRPAIDLNRVVMGGQVVAVVALLVLRGIVKARAKRKRQKVRMVRAERAHRTHAANRAHRRARLHR